MYLEELPKDVQEKIKELALREHIESFTEGELAFALARSSYFTGAFRKRLEAHLKKDVVELKKEVKRNDKKK